MEKFTRGKWEVNPRALRNVRCGDITIANCSQGQNGENEEEEIANAKLIASAPELLEALKNSKAILELYYKDHYTGSKLQIQIDNAINKATL